MKPITLASILALALVVACDDGSGSGSGGNGDTDTDTTTGGAGNGNGGDDGADGGGSTTGGDPCEDDYHGNNTPQTMFDLQLDTKNTATVVLGDGSLNTPAEQGGDTLAVCGGEPDFFTFTTECESYVSVEVRKLDGSEDPPNLYLYDQSWLTTSEPIDLAEGSFAGFFLRPIQQKVAAGLHVVEVRPLVSDRRAYSLTVTVFPIHATCP